MIPNLNYIQTPYNYPLQYYQPLPYNISPMDNYFYMMTNPCFGTTSHHPSSIMADSGLNLPRYDVIQDQNWQEDPEKSDPRPLSKEPEPQRIMEQNNPQGKSAEEINQKPLKTKKSASLSQNIAEKPELSRFVKKNTESNIVNQIFSFLWSFDKNQPFLTKILSTPQQIQVFNAIMKNIKTKCKSHLNRSFLKGILSVQKWPLIFTKLKLKIKDHEKLDDKLLALAFRKLTFIYLREISHYSIMTSKKMNKKLWEMHFQKCREIEEYLFEHKQ